MVAGMTALAVLAAGAGMSGVNVYAAENMQPKEEVVYVMTGADGTVESVNVVNIFGKGDVTDYGDYGTVKMLNATDAISLENGVVTFSTQKEKVYYQGTLENAQIPWKISVKYSLDGKEISPNELAGSTGQLDIALKVEKNDACRGEFYEDYALQVNMTLSTQNCENISAEGATVANVGADKQISYTVLPGKGAGGADCQPEQYRDTPRRKQCRHPRHGTVFRGGVWGSVRVGKRAGTVRQQL